MPANLDNANTIELMLGSITIANAAKLLSKFRCTIERYQQVGIQFAVHGNDGKSPPNKIPISIKKAVQALIKEKYFDLNLLHLAEQLEVNERIFVKRETLRGWAHDIQSFHKLGPVLFATINKHLAQEGMSLEEGTIVDATIKSSA